MLVELLNDCDCAGCGAALRGPSEGAPGLNPRRVWMSLGRSVLVVRSRIERSAGKANKVRPRRGAVLQLRTE